MVERVGIEPTIHGLKDCCLNRLGYRPALNYEFQVRNVKIVICNFIIYFG